ETLFDPCSTQDIKKVGV
nr:RecName: Full=Juvenile hormone-binding protein [Arctia virginalis]